MTVLSHGLGLICVVGLSVGQLLFKYSADSWATTGSLLAPKTAASLTIALTVYALTTLLWVWILQRSDLGKIYPLMALAFVLVPLGSHLLFGEVFPTRYIFGVGLVIIGILIIQ